MKAVAAIAVALALLACESATPASTSAQAHAPQTVDGSRRTAITTAVERVAPSVVTVQVETKTAAPADIFEMMGMRGPSGERVEASMGSGFVLRADGVVVTNSHVVNGATTVSVAMRDGTTYSAKVVGADELNDIAVLQINARNMPVAPLGNSSDVIVGEWAIAIGNPFGFVLGNPEPSVTAGVISGTGRNLLARAEGGAGTYDMIQTDAAINPGNSGGPLVNALGEVIGMNTIIYTPSQGSVGLGFAVPINRVKRVADDLLAHGEVRRPWVGLRLKPPSGDNPRDAVAMGAVVATVIPGSPAADADIRAGDQILSAGSQPVRNYYSWESMQLDLHVGDVVPIKLKRGNRELDVSVRVADLPDRSAPTVQVLNDLQIVTVTPAIRAERNIGVQAGALVTKVSPTLRQNWGLEVGDVIYGVHTSSTPDAGAVKNMLEQMAGRGDFNLWVERNGRRGTLPVAIRRT